ncbi:MAG: ABC transporter permease, partial [Cryobacterium sp.]|nr:ABC transporter permease [Cryobacterium sp.]
MSIPPRDRAATDRAPVRPRHPAPSFARSVWLVATREIMARLRSKAFLVSTGILLLISIGSVVAGSIASQNQTLPKVAVVGTAAQIVEQTQSFRMVEADDVAEAEALVRAETVSAAVVPGTATDAPLGVRVIALDSPPVGVLAALSITPTVSLLEPSTQQSGGLVYLVSLGFGLVFFMSAVTFGSTIAQSVVEEKQTRVVEILMTTIPVRALLGGKVVGNSIMAFGQIVAIGLLVAIGM